VVTPADAVRAGADILVVGRPITGADDPVEAAECIVEEMATAEKKE
jgi:orotidine-5'-phosphate decarboxylase